MHLSRTGVYTNSSQHENSIKSFKLAFGSEEDNIDGDTGILIVKEMLLTGFDAPVEQVMYLDRVIKAHNLLQAIARVNRVGGQGKDKGFVVDYVGIGHHLKRAIDNYDEREQSEIINTLSDPAKEQRELANDYATIKTLLTQHGLNTNFSKFTDDDLDAYYDVFYDEDIRFEYMQAFKQFTKSFNVVLPAKEALDYRAGYCILAEINTKAAQHFRDQRLSMKGIPPKLRTITDQHLTSRGISTKIAPISILDDDFAQEVKKRRRTKTKAAAVEHAIRNYLEIDLGDDPDLQASFAEAMTAIFEQFRDNWEQIYEALEELRTRIINASQEPTYGLDRRRQMPFFRCFRRELFPADSSADALSEEQISKLVNLTQEISAMVERELSLTGFWDSSPAQKKLEGELQKVLLSPAFIKLPNITQKRKHIISRIVEIAYRDRDILTSTA